MVWSAGERAHIVVLHEQSDANWRWISPHMPDVDWTFISTPVATSGLRNRLQILAAALRAAWVARRADLVVSLGPGLGSAQELARRLVRVKTPHVSYYLNFPHLPRGATRARQANTFRTIDRLVVSSTMERVLYAEHFGLDPDRIDVVLWGVNSPEASENEPEGAPYVCAVGGNARDYSLLIEVAKARPHIRFIIVARPANLEGQTLPDNVEARVNIPFADAMAIVKGSQLMALPLLSTDTPCGHVTIVAAQYLGKPLAVTNSAGVEDYVHDGKTGFLAETGSVEAMGKAIDLLWNDRAQAARFGAAGKAFAETACTELNYVKHVRGLLAPEH